MKQSKASVVIPVLMITVGIGWLLTIHHVIPGIDWIWVLGLAVVGFLILMMGGINKVTVVAGPFLLIGTVFSLLRQTSRISVDTEVSSLVIVAGVLVLLARCLPIPMPDWLVEDREESQK